MTTIIIKPESEIDFYVEYSPYDEIFVGWGAAEDYDYIDPNVLHCLNATGTSDPDGKKYGWDTLILPYAGKTLLREDIFSYVCYLQEGFNSEAAELLEEDVD